MIRDCAVEPEAFDSWERFLFVTQKFGYDKGMVISQFPGKWEKRVIKQLMPALSGTVKATRLTELLRSYRSDRLRKTGRLWDSSLDWLDNALTQQVSQEPFDLIVGSKADASRQVVGIDDDDETVFFNQRERVCLRTANSLAAHILPVVRQASIVKLVDRQLLKSSSQTHRWFDLPRILHSKLNTGAASVNFEFHCVTREDDPSNFLGNLERQVNSKLGGLGIHFYIWQVGEAEDSSHARYVLSDLAGVRVDAGLDDVGPGFSTDIGLLEESLRKRRFEDFSKESSPYQLYRDFVY